MFSAGVNAYIGVVAPAIDFIYRVNLDHTFANYTATGISQTITPFTSGLRRRAPARAGIASSR